ncbi:MAG: YcxB family protein [Verrucomicrobiota bacterium]
MPKFEFTFTEEHFLTIFQKRAQISKQALVFKILRILLLVPLAFLFYATLQTGETILMVVIILIALLLLFSKVIERWMLIQSFRNSPFRNEQISIQLTDEGYIGEGTVGSTKLGWTAFTKAVRFEDGLLLFQGPGLNNWLPFSTLVEGSPDDVAGFVQSKVSDFQNRR